MSLQPSLRAFFRELRLVHAPAGTSHSSSAKFVHHQWPGIVPADCTQVSTAQMFNVLTTKKVYEPEFSSTVCNSEANAVINNYNALSSSPQSDVLNFLRSS